MGNDYLFTSESVTGGHPDKLCDQIADAVLDAMLAHDPASRVAVECLIGHGQLTVAGEATTEAYVPVAELARQVMVEVGYDSAESGLDGAVCGVNVQIEDQSPEIGAGVSHSLESRGQDSADSLEAQGAGDQGMVFGFACDETQELMPLPIHLAHRLAEQLQAVRLDGVLPMLRPDGKTQVTVAYQDGRPVGIDTVVVSAQHHPDVTQAQLADMIRQAVIDPVLVKAGFGAPRRVLVNPSGSFVHGGPYADTGLTGRKLIVDSYGGMARHGGGALSGKDPSKVDRSAAYAARLAAKTVVAAGLARRCELQVAYAIGAARPVAVFLETFGTASPGTDDAALSLALQRVFDLRPAAIVRDLDLKRPIYRPTATFGHFGRPGLPWEDTSRAEALAESIGLTSEWNNT